MSECRICYREASSFVTCDQCRNKVCTECALRIRPNRCPFCRHAPLVQPPERPVAPRRHVWMSLDFYDFAHSVADLADFIGDTMDVTDYLHEFHAYMDDAPPAPPNSPR